MSEMLKDAVIDQTGMYRYSLRRIWNTDLPKVLFIMLNPSTADDQEDDPTIRRCIGFAKYWGYGSLEVMNLFAYRATDPSELRKVVDPIGPDNDIHIFRAAIQTDLIITAWGTHGPVLGRNLVVMENLYSFRTYCLGVSKGGHPKHPLYIPGDQRPISYPLETIS